MEGRLKWDGQSTSWKSCVWPSSELWPPLYELHSSIITISSPHQILTEGIFRLDNTLSKPFWGWMGSRKSHFTCTYKIRVSLQGMGCFELDNSSVALLQMIKLQKKCSPSAKYFNLTCVCPAQSVPHVTQCQYIRSMACVLLSSVWRVLQHVFLSAECPTFVILFCIKLQWNGIITLLVL